MRLRRGGCCGEKRLFSPQETLIAHNQPPIQRVSCGEKGFVVEKNGAFLRKNPPLENTTFFFVSGMMQQLRNTFCFSVHKPPQKKYKKTSDYARGFVVERNTVFLHKKP